MLSLLLFACTGAPAPEPDPATGVRTVRVALNWFPEPEFGGFYEGVLGGHYEQAGFDVELIPGGPGAPTLELLATGKAEVAITASDELLLKRTKGVAAVGVWPAFQLAPNGLMVHADGPSSFDEITGGQIAIEVGSPFQSFLWKQYGWDGQVAAVPYAGGVGQFLADPAHIQQAYITSEPCLAQAKGAEVRFLRASEAGWNPYGTLVAFPEPVPEWAPAFIAATEAAWQAYLADPSRANARLAELNDQLDDALLACITEAQAPFVTGTDGLGTMTPVRWNAMAATLVELGLLQGDATGAWTVLD